MKIKWNLTDHTPFYVVLHISTLILQSIRRYSFTDPSNKSENKRKDIKQNKEEKKNNINVWTTLSLLLVADKELYKLIFINIKKEHFFYIYFCGWY